MRAPLLAVCVLPLLGVPEAFGQAQRRVDRLAVLPIIVEGEHGQATLSSVFDDISSSAAGRLGLSLISYEEIDSKRGVSDRVLDCASDEACIASKLRAFDARMGMVVVVNMALNPPLVSLLLIDTDAHKAVSRSAGRLAELEKSISEAIRARASKMFDEAQYIHAARVVVDVNPPRALVTLGEGIEPDKGTPNVFTLGPGRYRVQANLDGYFPAEGEVDAVSGDEVRISLTLEEDVSLVDSPWLWGGVAAAVAGGATVALFALRSTTRCLCVTLNGAGCDQCP